MEDIIKINKLTEEQYLKIINHPSLTDKQSRIIEILYHGGNIENIYEEMNLEQTSQMEEGIKTSITTARKKLSKVFTSILMEEGYVPRKAGINRENDAVAQTDYSDPRYSKFDDSDEDRLNEILEQRYGG